ncbi:MAG: D-3-phosphoglycerate dehydrogenase / 2-oxoglutarate reductase [Actinomycetota bacterium]|jgi:D-3-phosphoglycerate dehydrogenase|nr:D-3-phosphoglycerate dehydrogenase / 2-oxoglutarate reductase [Actinomycetota bacterium]
MGAMKVLVSEPLSDAGLARLRDQHQVDVLADLSPSQLLEVIPTYDALIVRSATKVTSEVLQAALNLKVVGRAGIGLDNIDVEAATRHGVLVVNAPQSNVLSAAEHTMALLLAQARNVPQAHAALIAGSWERERWQGVELHGKTLGVVGLGRVGTLVAQRASAFGMQVIAFDPYVPPARAAQMGVELIDTVVDVCHRADFLTIHLPKTAETAGLIGERELLEARPGIRIVNTARGGLIDEDALLRALKDGRVAGAAIDVFEGEPVTEHPLFGFDNVVVTPHLGASTVEAQDKAGLAIAEQVLLALAGDFVPFAVNVDAGTEIPEPVRPYLRLAERLGRMVVGLSAAGVESIRFGYNGQIADHDTRALTLAGLKGAFSSVVHEPVTFVNAPLLARERGISYSESKCTTSNDYVNLIDASASSSGQEVTVAGVLAGKRGIERLVRVYGYDIDMAFAPVMAFFLYEDRPGIVGIVGTLLGQAGVNIANMQVGRQTQGGEALMGLALDSPIPAPILDDITRTARLRGARLVVLEAGLESNQRL